ncbi:MAG: carbamoyltransferase C-terminal domain-containing protein, partial [Chitinophagaceae bacterium]
MDPVYILGLNFAYHELSACILKNGELITAAEEERFTRIKRGKAALVDNPNVLPELAIRHCLNAAGITYSDINYIGLSFFPEDRLKNINADTYFDADDWGSERGEQMFYQKITGIPALLNQLAGIELTDKIIWIPHHKCHAGSAFFVSPFSESAILAIDGIGEFSTTWMGHGKDNSIELIKEIAYPNSLGFLWEKFSKYIGFTEYDSSKIMGLAAYGNGDRFYSVMQNIVTLAPEGEFIIDNEIMRFRVNDFAPLENLFHVKRIYSPLQISQDQKDIAAALQKITDDVFCHLGSFLKDETQSSNICLAGGVALNCVSNGYLMQTGLFKQVYVQPAANDAGTALGAAYHIWNQVLGNKRTFVMDKSYWGTSYSDNDIKTALDNAGVHYEQTSQITKEAAKKISEGKIVGWFQGKMEWGPRALGNRSLLADPRHPEMKRILNERIKKRESFRPFAPSVLMEQADDWFVIPAGCKSISAEFMTINFKVKTNKSKNIPAVTHEDGTSRVQFVKKENNSLYYQLISDFHSLTGVPLVLNTSFNDNEPIV